MNERVTDLEIRLTYQESALNELNDVVIKQQDQIDRLIAELGRMKQQFDGGVEFVSALSEEPPPPHY